MTTLSDSDRAALREEVKREVKEEFRREDRTRRIRSFFVSLAVYALFVGLPLVMVAVMLTRAGMMQMPLLTGMLYHPVAPTRLVQPLVGESADIAWKEALATAKFDQETDQMTISMDENRLTTIVRQGLVNQASSLPFKAEDAQIALDSDRAELFFNTERAGEKVPVRLVFLPSVDRHGELVVDVSDVTIGGASVPAAMRSPMANLLNSFLRNEFMSQMPAGFILRRFEVKPEGMSIVFTAPTK